MGIRSDVALAIKNQAFLGLSDKSKETIREYFTEPVDRDWEDGATLFMAYDVKWYHDCFADIVNLYRDLCEQDEEDYIVVKACHDYPSSEDGDIGGWFDNPFGIHKCVSVSIERY